MRITRMAVSWLAAGLLAVVAQAQTYHMGPTYSQIVTFSEPAGCSWTLYDPAITYNSSTQQLYLVMQGNSPTACGDSNHGADAIFESVRNPANGQWSAISSTSCPTLQDTSACTYPNPGVWASPSIVQVPGDSRFFMAFVGGGSDFSKGKLFWAVSNDGVNWTPYNWNLPPNEVWTPLIYPKYGDECGVNSHLGLGQVSLSYENGYFYIIMNYIHRYPYGGSGAQTLDEIAYRVSYNPGHFFGFGPVHQIYFDPDGPPDGMGGGTGPGSWVSHSGHFVFAYDNQPPETGDPTLGYFTSMWSLHNGGKDIQYDAGRGKWIHVFNPDDDPSHLYWQENTSLANNTWSARVQIDSATLNGGSGRFPGRRIQYPGIWYGTVPGQPSPKMYIFVPVDYRTSSCATQDNPFLGLGIVSAELNYF